MVGRQTESISAASFCVAASAQWWKVYQQKYFCTSFDIQLLVRVAQMRKKECVKNICNVSTMQDRIFDENLTTNCELLSGPGGRAG